MKLCELSTRLPGRSEGDNIIACSLLLENNFKLETPESDLPQVWKQIFFDCVPRTVNQGCEATWDSFTPLPKLWERTVYTRLGKNQCGQLQLKKKKKKHCSSEI